MDIKEVKMKISPISSTLSKPNFKGQFAYNYNESTLKNNKLWQKNSSVEQTLGAYHVNKTSQAYFADPLEPISDAIKEKADYIVYDNEPAYPEINEVSKNYFGTQRKNYRDDFEEVRQYYYRREMGGFADKADAKYQQWQAAECTRMYDNAGDLRYKKETAEDEVKNLSTKKEKILSGISNTEQELRAQQDLKVNIDKHITDLEKLEKPYKELGQLASDGAINEQSMYGAAAVRMHNKQDKTLEYGKYQNTPETYKNITSEKDQAYRMSESKKALKEEHKKLQDTIAEFKSIQAGCAKTIKNMKEYIAALKTDVSNIDRKVAEKKSFIEDCKAKLIPLFDELKNFYAKQGIKVIKRG